MEYSVIIQKKVEYTLTHQAPIAAATTGSTLAY